MILLIDNYDSFVYNLARYIGHLGRQRRVVRNDEISVDEITAMAPEAIILSNGPCTPKEAGICNEIILHFSGKIPLLGLSLGHQCIGEAFGGCTVQAPQLAHGKSTTIRHRGKDLFMGLPSPLEVACYHSLVTEINDKNSVLEVTARSTDDRIIMGLQHRHYPVYGLQFLPESILTPYGVDIVRNFITVTDQWNERQIAA